jgi:hypothetical protein
MPEGLFFNDLCPPNVRSIRILVKYNPILSVSMRSTEVSRTGELLTPSDRACNSDS